MNLPRALWMATMLWLVTLGSMAVAQDPKKADEKKEVKKAPAPASINVHFRVDLGGELKVPSESTIHLRSTEQEGACKSISIDRLGKLGSDGAAVFKAVPVCRVIVTVSVTGFGTKKVPVDLATYKDSPILIDMK